MPSKKKIHTQNRSLGVLSDLQNTDHGLVGTTSFGMFRIRVYTPSIVRIQLSVQLPDDAETGYAVVARPDKNTAFSLKEEAEKICLQTDFLDVEIRRNPVRFCFKNKAGKILNADDPAFGTSWLGDKVTTYKKLQAGERFIGLGEKTGPLDRRGRGYVNWNTDHFAYPAEGDPLYASLPFYIGIHHGLVYGIFFDNSYQAHFNFGASNDRFSSFGANDGEMNYYFIGGNNVGEILKSYTRLTGRTPLPPRWSLGYQQCRYSYYPDTEVLNLANTFREKQIPADAITLDIHYMDAYKIFTWDKARFPTPAKMIDRLKAQGFRLIVIMDPGIKIDADYSAYAEGLAEGLFITYPDGTNYTAEVWPGKCHFPDFTNPKVRQWWAARMKAYTDLGIEGFWNDMNEIATWGQKLPALLEFDFEGDGASTQAARNVYGLQMARSTYEGGKKQLNKRPFVLSRAAYAGIQRYAALWTGDNVATDEHLLLGVRMINSIGVSGVAFAGYDVGGFVGNPDAALFARWISVGAFAPFFRGHSMINSHRSEPWSFGEETEEIARNYICLRYRLMPYLYATFFQAAETGMPVVRTLAITHTHDEKIYDRRFENQYFFGDAILVCPLESTKDIAKIYLPQGAWYCFYSDKKYAGKQIHFVDAPKEKLPLLVKSSSIIPMQTPKLHTQAAGDGILQIHLYYGQERTKFVYYEDDGESFDYQKGAFCKRTLTYEKREFTVGEQEGSFSSVFKQIKLLLHGFGEVKNLRVNGKNVPLNTEKVQFLAPISNFDPLGKAYAHDVQLLPTAIFEHLPQKIEVEIG